MAGLYDYLTPGQPESYISGFDPRFASALEKFISASPGITIYSGARSNERQAELYQAAIQKYGSPQAARKWVAPPGRSKHNLGIAADLRYASDAARQWAHERAGEYGLAFPMSHEPWHVEPIGARGKGGPGLAALAEPRAPKVDMLAAAMGDPRSPLPMENPLKSLVQQSVMAPPDERSGQRETPWIENTRYTPDAVLSDVFSGRNPLKRLAYQSIMGLFS